MKKCPYCAEEIQNDAIRCRRCQELLGKKWYFRTSTLIIAFLSIGPFALPLVLFNPRFTGRKKILISTIVIIITYLMVVVLSQALRIITEYYGLAFGSLGCN